jgi:hypothetical protein
MLDGDAVGDAAYDPIAAICTDFVQRLAILNAENSRQVRTAQDVLHRRTFRSFKATRTNVESRHATCPLTIRVALAAPLRVRIRLQSATELYRKCTL